MKNYIALFRGINVGGRNRLPMRALVLRLTEFEAAVESNPYPEAASEPKSLHLYFLTSTPESPDLEALEGLRSPSERFALQGECFYLHAPEGIGRSRLAASVEKALGVGATARNWRTVTEIMALAKR